MGGVPDAVDAVFCAPDDGWWYHPKHAEKFPDKINCVTLHLVVYILEYDIFFWQGKTSVIVLQVLGLMQN